MQGNFTYRSGKAAVPCAPADGSNAMLAGANCNKTGEEDGAKPNGRACGRRYLGIFITGESLPACYQDVTLLSRLLLEKGFAYMLVLCVRVMKTDPSS